MRYWVYINDQVSQEPYEVKDLFSIPGFGNETLIMPETSGGEWLAAYNYTDVQEVFDSMNEESAKEPEVETYEEPTDRSAIPPQYQEASQNPEGGELEKTLLLKIEELTKEVRELKQEIQVLGTEVSSANRVQSREEKPAPIIYGAAGAAAGAAVAAAAKSDCLPQNNYQPEPVLKEISDTEELKDLDNTVTLSSENFLQDAVQADISEKQAQSAAREESSLYKKPEIIDLKTQTTRTPVCGPAHSAEEDAPAQQTPVEEPAAEKDLKTEAMPLNNEEPEAPAEEAPLEPLPVEEELQAEELEAEPFTPAAPSAEEALKDHSAQEEGEYIPQPVIRPVQDEEPVSILQEEEPPAQQTPVEEPAAVEPVEEPVEVVREEAEPVVEEALPQEEQEPAPVQEQPAEYTQEAEPVAAAAEEYSPAPAEEVVEPVAQAPQAAAAAEIVEDKDEETARIASIPNEQEDSILNEFAQEKSIPAQQTPADENLYIIENSEEETPKSLDELTARTPIAGAQEQGDVQNIQTLEDDKFLKTFTTGIEEVFMDQPTSIISDYVPPAIAETSPLSPAAQPQPEQLSADKQEEAAAPVESAPLEDLIGHKTEPSQLGTGRVQNTQQTVQSVRRIKPAAIKTVPMVSADGKDISNIDYGMEPQVEEVTIESQGGSFLKFTKMFGALTVLLVMLLMLAMLVAWLGFMPKEWSPLHSVLDKLGGSKVETTAPIEESGDGLPAAPAQNGSAAQTEQDQALASLHSRQILSNVKNYLLLDGMTLGEKVNAAHPGMNDVIQWIAEPAPDPSSYSILVSLPPNQDGFTVSYRFNYDMNTRTLTPTNSPANNLMNQRMAMTSAQ